eukprot:GILJ01009482.1.p1 GENE.GILJ01009482.1~~GILJ01009482.1.p1  ORF type:complete len:410 (+),score=50.76 GILJ01009482.1:23-1231(+)
MKLVSWNVNSLRALDKRLAETSYRSLNELFKKLDADIYCFQETKMTETMLDYSLATIEGYESYWSFTKGNKGYSGVVTYCRVAPLHAHEGFGVSEFDQEGRCVMTDHGSFILFNLYFPNSGSGDDRMKYKVAFHEAFQSEVEKLLHQGRNIIVTGDVNIAHTELDVWHPAKFMAKQSAGCSTRERNWIDRFLKCGFKDAYRELHPNDKVFSWWDQRNVRARICNEGWRIDYFFVSSSFFDQVVESDILTKVVGSDHCPITLLLKEQPPLPIHDLPPNTGRLRAPLPTPSTNSQLSLLKFFPGKTSTATEPAQTDDSICEPQPQCSMSAATPQETSLPASTLTASVAPPSSTAPISARKRPRPSEMSRDKKPNKRFKQQTPADGKRSIASFFKASESDKQPQQ